VAREITLNTIRPMADWTALGSDPHERRQRWYAGDVFGRAMDSGRGRRFDHMRVDGCFGLLPENSPVLTVIARQGRYGALLLELNIVCEAEDITWPRATSTGQ
jgi:hypothetical protein